MAPGSYGSRRLSPAFLAIGLAGLALIALCLGVLAMARGYALLKLTQTASEPVIARQSANWPGAAPRTLVIGDSRVAHWQPAENSHGLRLATSGVGGETSGQLLARWQRTAPPPPGTRVVIMTGVNDLVAADLNPARAAGIESALVANVAALAGQLERRQMSPVIAAVGQASDIDWRRRLIGWSGGLYALIDSTNAKLLALARAEGYGWVDTNRALEVGTDRHIAARFATDTLHWNDAAYRALEGALAAAERQPE